MQPALRRLKAIALTFLLFTLPSLADEMPNLRCLCVGPDEDLPETVKRFGLERVVMALFRHHGFEVD